MSDLNKDILVGAIFMGGIFGFVSGAYVASSALFATVAVINSIHYSLKTQTAGVEL